MDFVTAVRKLSKGEAEADWVVANAKQAAYREAVSVALERLGVDSLPENNSIEETSTPDGAGGLTVTVKLTYDT